MIIIILKFAALLRKSPTIFWLNISMNVFQFFFMVFYVFMYDFYVYILGATRAYKRRCYLLIVHKNLLVTLTYDIQLKTTIV